MTKSQNMFETYITDKRLIFLINKEFERKEIIAKDCIAKLLEMLTYSSPTHTHTHTLQVAGVKHLKRYSFLLIIRKLKNLSFLSAFCPSFQSSFTSYLPYSFPKPKAIGG